MFAGFATVERLPLWNIGPEDDPIVSRHRWEAFAMPPTHDEGTRQQVDPSLGAKLVSYATGSVESGNGAERFALVHGKVLAPQKVSAVEVVFDNGRTVRRDTERAVFAVAGRGATDIRHLRVLDGEGTVLESVNLWHGAPAGD